MRRGEALTHGRAQASVTWQGSLWGHKITPRMLISSAIFSPLRLEWGIPGVPSMSLARHVYHWQPTEWRD